MAVEGGGEELYGDGVKGRNELSGDEVGDGVKGDHETDDGGGVETEGGGFRFVVPWIMAMAEEEREAGWWERRRWNPKRMGEVSQAAFLLKARTLEFGVALPWGDSEKYDFIVWAGEDGRMLRVQVKATGRLNGGGYDVQPVYSTRGEGKKIYTEEDIDVLAAHVMREEGGEVWYLLPVGAFAGVKSLRLFPDLKSRNPRWEGYRESWEWLGMSRGDRGKGVGRSGGQQIRRSRGAKRGGLRG